MIHFPKVDEQNRYVPFGSRSILNKASRSWASCETPARTSRAKRCGWFTCRSMTTKIFPMRYTCHPAAIRSRSPRRQGALCRKFKGRLVVINQWVIDERVDGGLGQERLLSRLLSFFGVLGLILASVGLFGVLSYSVVRHWRDRHSHGAGRAPIAGDPRGAGRDAKARAGWESRSAFRRHSRARS